ncbi:LytR/AlgR family response regulator transcription factor [Pedobacter hiemivivus]|uniref:LytTR family transcriptional regulator n=1 Tax=Pedobacter hiemivivus TaxID=2530454 RepID=A0A4V2MJL4_9SPHI|nr:LytTR family transcriptional regulator [Pedobacter hiemivivus]
MKKLVIHSQEILRLVSHADISYCKSDNCYTSIFLHNREELVMCKSLKKVSQQLDAGIFIRVHQSHLINKNCIKLINKKNKYIELVCGTHIPFTTTINELMSSISGS